MDKPLALIIDDDRDIVALFRHVLDLAGYRTEIILHGKVAVERLSRCQPDVVLLDLSLPGVTGGEILHLIRSDPRLNRTKVVVVTANSHIAGTLVEEPELVLLKPVNIEQLTHLVQRLSPTQGTREEAAVDALTGFYNRSFFRSRLDYSLARSKQIDLNHFTVLLAELNNFGQIEAQLGEQESCHLLKETARLLHSALRPTDTVARFEHAQFAILIEDVTNWDIPIMVANRILERFGAYFDYNNIPLKGHVGIILCDTSYYDVDEILRDVKVALSLAKVEAGKRYKFLARDEFNNTYDIDMISAWQGNRVMGQTPSERTGVRVKSVDTRPRTLGYAGTGP